MRAVDNQASELEHTSNDNLLLIYQSRSLLCPYPHQIDNDIRLNNDFYGFTPLHQPQESVAVEYVSDIQDLQLADASSYSIIAETGLTARIYGSWTHSAHSMWLRGFFPRDVNNARVLIYGYPSHLHDNTSRSILSVPRQNLIHRLLTMRELSPRFVSSIAYTHSDLLTYIPSKCQDRPIVSIDHSLSSLITSQVARSGSSSSWTRSLDTHLKALRDINAFVDIYSSRSPVQSTTLPRGGPHQELQLTALETFGRDAADRRYGKRT